MPLIAWAVMSWVAGLLIGASDVRLWPVLGVAAAVSSALVLAPRSRGVVAAGCVLLAAAAVMTARDRIRRDARCRTQAVQTADVSRARSQAPCATERGALARLLLVQRERAGRLIDRDFGGDAPMVRALLIADTHELPLDLRDRFASAGLVHILSISGLHVALIAEAVAVILGALHLDAANANVVIADTSDAEGAALVDVFLLLGFALSSPAVDLGTALGGVANGCRVLVPYLRGYGPTRFLSAATPRSGEQAVLGNDLLQFMDALGIPKALLMGFDWGGRAACIVAALWPGRVRGRPSPSPKMSTVTWLSSSQSNTEPSIGWPMSTVPCGCTGPVHVLRV